MGQGKIMASFLMTVRIWGNGRIDEYCLLVKADSPKDTVTQIFILNKQAHQAFRDRVNRHGRLNYGTILFPVPAEDITRSTLNGFFADKFW
jgi:hypothetical protein